jgi:hypothetical protein
VERHLLADRRRGEGVEHDYNAAIAQNGSAEFGFLASWTGTNGTPTSFRVNGAACS